MSNKSEIQNSFMNNLPAGWKYVRLLDYCELIRGTEPGSENYNTEKNGIPFLRVGNIVSGRQNLVYTTQKYTKTCESDDILLTLDGSPGIVTTGWAGAYSSGIRKIVIKDNSLDKNFLYFALQTKQVRDVIEKYTTGVTIKHASKSIPFISFPLPSLREQQAIARALDTVRQAIYATDRVIAATRELKHSMMKHLFTYGPVPIDQIDQVQLKQTEIGEIPQEWNVAELGQIVYVLGGKRLPKGHSFSKETTPYPYIRVKDLIDASVDFFDIKYLSESDWIKLKKYIISCDDVYISIAGTIGLVGSIPYQIDNAVLTENAAKIRIKDKSILTKDYLIAYLASANGQIQIDIRTTKTSQPKLALARIKQIPIPLPPITIQNSIGNYFDAINNKIKIETKIKSTLDTLFYSLVNALCNGYLRIDNG